MKRENRIRKNKDFKTIIAKRNVVTTNQYIIYQSKNDLGFTRIGISVSKKIGIAVTRNKIKRQIRAMVNKITDYKQNLDIVIIVKESYKKHTFEENFLGLKEIVKELQ